MGTTPAGNGLVENIDQKLSSNQFEDFDDVLEEVGSVGKYQRIFLYGILLPLSVFESLFAINLWFLLDEPDHWCKVPLEAGANLNAWKNSTIPQDDNGHFSKCEMFDFNHTQVPCTAGWEYDFSSINYRSILVDYDWVCEKSHYVTWIHTATNTGRALGTLLLGFLADKIGRKKVFIITLMLFSCGRAISLYFASNIVAFVGISLITGMSAPMFAISVNTIAIELSGKEYRAWIYSFTWMTLVIGAAAVPTIAYLSSNWFMLGWITISIASISYLFIPWIPESPRWLLSVGRLDEVAKILGTISNYNGTSEKFKNSELLDILKSIEKTNKTDEHEDKQKMAALFSKWGIAKHTSLIIITWVLNGLVFHGLNLNSLNLHGHRYLNFFLVMLMEVPGGFFGGILSNKFGRRWMQVLFFAMCSLSCIAAAFFSWVQSMNGDDSSFLTIAIIIAANAAKFISTMAFLINYLQALELFPTPLRTTGCGLASTLSNISIIIVPWIVYQGKTSQLTPWVVNAVLSFAGMISAAFLPETLNHKLPETLQEANNFGKGRDFWSFRLTTEDEDKPEKESINLKIK